MPELPEVEHFRRLLLPLQSDTTPLVLEICNDNPSKKFVTPEQVSFLNDAAIKIKAIRRRGKLICMDLSNQQFLLVHMGMTGRITTPIRAPCFGHNSSEEGHSLSLAPSVYPPPYTYLRFRVGSADACFSDPRKFGKVCLEGSDVEFRGLAPDALEESHKLEEQIVTRLTNLSSGIKGVMMDQKRVVSGIGNWVADEVLYQAHLHPDQTHLKSTQAVELIRILRRILQTAVDCLDKGKPYPTEWIFHYRWTRKQASKDASGRKIEFLTSGGRTSAIVPAVQKKRNQEVKKPPNDRGTGGAKGDVVERRAKKDLAETDRSITEGIPKRNSLNKLRRKPGTQTDVSTDTELMASNRKRPFTPNHRTSTEKPCTSLVVNTTAIRKSPRLSDTTAINKICDERIRR